MVCLSPTTGRTKPVARMSSTSLLPLPEAARRFGLSYQRLYKWCRRGLVRCRRGKDRTILVDPLSIEERLLPSGWIRPAEVPGRYPLSRDRLLRLIRSGRVRARKVGGLWWVEAASLEACLKESAFPPGHVTTGEAARRLGVGRREILRRICAGRLRARRCGRRWAVEASSLEASIPPPGWTTAQEAARRAGKSESTIYRWIRAGRLPARRVGKRWFIEERSLPAGRPEGGRKEVMGIEASGHCGMDAASVSASF